MVVGNRKWNVNGETKTDDRYLKKNNKNLSTRRRTMLTAGQENSKQYTVSHGRRFAAER